jgi:hypothetical protein
MLWNFSLMLLEAIYNTPFTSLILYHSSEWWFWVLEKGNNFPYTENKVTQTMRKSNTLVALMFNYWSRYAINWCKLSNSHKHEADFSPPWSAKIKNEWNYVSKKTLTVHSYTFLCTNSDVSRELYYIHQVHWTWQQLHDFKTNIINA